MTKKDTKQIIKRLGGPYAVAEKINQAAKTEKERITPQAISLWVVIPPARCLQIELAFPGQVTRFEMNPNIFGEDVETDVA